MDEDQAVFTSLLLVIVLDYLKSSITGPPLFQSVSEFLMMPDTKESTIISSAKMAVEISRLGLCGEGNTIRHLESITKWSFSQQQYPLDRFQYSITNVATDFRDGVRLTKLVELLSAKDHLTPLLQWPVNNSAQRIYNLNIALNAVLSNGIELTTENEEIVQAKDIEMGHREKTLAILWNIIHYKCLPQYLACTHLQEEVTALKRLCQIRRKKIPQLLVMVISSTL
jgi:abnormal spindle-like microcephaly-associated protein